MTVSQDPYLGRDPYLREETPADSPSGSAKDQAQDRAHEVKDTAQQRAQDVAGTAKSEAGQVASTAKEQAQAVTSEVRQQTQKLAGDAQTQLMEHATAQRDSLADNLRSIGEELSSMSDRADTSGLGVQMARQGGDFASKAAQFLQDRDPGELLDEVRSLARRRPGAFLLGAAFAGVLAGRAARGMKSAHSSGSGAPSSAASPAYDVSQTSMPAPGFADESSVSTTSELDPATDMPPLSASGYPTTPQTAGSATTSTTGSAGYPGTTGAAGAGTPRGSELP